MLVVHKRSRPSEVNVLDTRTIYGMVTFPSVRQEQFRVTFGKDNDESPPSSSAAADTENVYKIRLEGRTSKKQWEASVGSAEPTINCIAKEAVIHALTVTDGSTITTSTTQEGKDSTTRIDFLNSSTDEATISLAVPFFGSTIAFQFKARSIPLQDVDVLRAQVIDAQEEILALKEAIKSIQAAPPPQFMTLNGSGSVEGGGRAVKWTKVVHNTAQDIFAVATNAKSVTVLQPGIYHIHVRRGVTEHDKDFSIQLNGKSVITQSSPIPIIATNNDAFQSALSLRETLTLQAQDSLRVVSTSSSSTVIQNTGNVFSVLKLA
eukprot:gene32408-41989_t